MFRNFLVTAIRSLLRQKLFTTINVLGLTIGITTSVLISLWVLDELSYDNFHPDRDRIYQVYEWQNYSQGEPFPTYATPGPLAPALEQNFPEIEIGVRFSRIWTETTLQYGDKVFHEAHGFVADPQVFQMFNFPMILGDPLAALGEPRSMVINRRTAEKYFGMDWQDRDILEETILMDNQWSYKITGVVDNVPSNSVFDFDFLVPFVSIKEIWDFEGYNEWGNNFTATYVRLASTSDYQAVGEKIKGLVKKHNEGSSVDLYLMPMDKVYLHTISGEGGRIKYVRIFSLVAVFVLLIACINFTNLATAQAGYRSREVGIRKTLGAQKLQLVFQFLFESVALALLALILAMVAIQLLLLPFNTLTGKSIQIDYSQWQFLLGLVAVSVFTGILAGLYPAFYLSSFQPFQVLKGLVKLHGGSLRKALVIMQFVLSVVLIISSIAVYRQLHFLQGKELGYNKENTVYFEIRHDAAKRVQLLRDEFDRVPEVLSLTTTQNLPINSSNSTSNVSWDEKDPDATILIHYFVVGQDYTKTLGMTLVAGRDFLADRTTDTSSFLVNQKMLEVMGKDVGVGEPIEMWGTKGKIIGVIKDFNFKKLTEGIEPAIFRLERSPSPVVVLRLAGSDVRKSIDRVEEVWTKVSPDLPFDYKFLDQEYDQLYRSEATMGNLFSWFAGLAIFISCLGLFGLSAFIVESKKKEIGIRKVLGATVGGITWLFSTIFIRWVLIANFVALPTAYWLMDQWLEDYMYRIDLDLWIFFTATFVSVVIALATTIYQSFRSATRNPVESLAQE